MNRDESRTSTSHSKITVWLLASRPKTLLAAVCPVGIGTAMAVAAGSFHAAAAFVALACSVLIQVGTNLANDYHDFLKGADTENRKGPLRVTQAGLLSAEAVRRATFGVFAVAFVLGLYLVFRGGWPILLVGLLSILFGVLYTAGRFSLAYLGVADLFVLVFFGPVAVAGTYYVQALALPPLVVVAGLAPGVLSTAILLVNNIRDVEEDRVAGKRTLVVRLGRSTAVRLYGVCVVGALLVPAALVAWTGGGHPWSLLALLALPLALRNTRRLAVERDPFALNPLLGATAGLLLVYTVLFSIGWLIA